MKELIYPYTLVRLIPTFRCNYDCIYCSCKKYQEDLWRGNEFNKEERPVDDWIERMATLYLARGQLIIVFCAMETLLYKDVSKLINTLDKPNMRTSLYTNLSPQSMPELRKIKPRDNFQLYISYHPQSANFDEFVKNAKEVVGKWKIIDIHGVSAPEQNEQVKKDGDKMRKMGLPFRNQHPYIVTKKGEYKFYNTIGELPRFKNRFISRVEGVPTKTVYCKVSFNHHCGGQSGLSYPIAPNGDIYVCWRHLLNKNEKFVIGNFFDDNFKYEDIYYECEFYGDCNACAWDRNIIDKESGEQLDTDVIRWESIR